MLSVNTADPPKLFYGWIVVASCCLLGMSAAVLLTYGIYVKELSAEFGWNRAVTSSVSSVTNLVYGIAAVCAGMFADRFNPKWPVWICAVLLGSGLCLCSLVQNIWQLYFFYGVVTAIGAGCCYSLPSSIVQKWFIEKRGLALGLSMCGIGLGTLAISVLVGFLVPAFGWRTAIFAEGVLLFILLAVAALFIAGDPEKKGFLPYGAENCVAGNGFNSQKEWLLKKIITRKSFLLNYGINFFSNASLMIVLVHVVPYAEDMGISKLVAAGAMGLMGGVSAVGRLVVGGVCDKIGFKNGLIISLGLCCSMILYLIMVRNVWMLYVFVAVFSVGYGGKAMALPGLVGDVFGTRSLGMIMGLLATAYGMGGFIGPLLGGWIFDQTHSYVMAFIAGAFFYIVSIILSVLVKQEEDLQLADTVKKPSSIPG